MVSSPRSSPLVYQYPSIHQGDGNGKNTYQVLCRNLWACFNFFQRAPCISSQAIILTKFRLTSSLENFSSNNNATTKCNGITQTKREYCGPRPCILKDTTICVARERFSHRKKALFKPGNARLQKWRTWKRRSGFYPPADSDVCKPLCACPKLSFMHHYHRVVWNMEMFDCVSLH